MSGASKDKMKLAVELVRKGGIMLGEPCAKCGGVRVRYSGKVYCTGHEDLTLVAASEMVSAETALAGMKEVLISKLNEATMLLSQEKDTVKQEQVVSLMARCYDLLEKLSRVQQRP